MKTFPAILLLCALCCCPALRLQAQVNLVPNPSFEQYTQCPTTGENEVHLAIGWWEAVDTAFSTPDWFHTCASNPNSRPPNPNSVGYQFPVTGEAYCHVATYVEALPDYREIIQAQLTAPLSIGQTYYVSFYASPTGGVNSRYATNKLGALFTTYKFEAPNFAIPNNFAHVYADSILSDTVNWYHIKGSFVADSAYQYIAMGNFFDGANTDTMNIGGSFPLAASYFIDDICVSVDSSLCYIPSPVQEMTLNEDIFVYPNPASEYITIKQNNRQVNEGIIFNAIGQVVASVNTGANKTTISCSDWPSGLYMLRIQSYNHKIIIYH